MSLTCSPSIGELKLVQADRVPLLRSSLKGLNVRDVVPYLVARNVLKSNEMSRVYTQETEEAQIDALIEILKTKNYWFGAFTDALIRNGQIPLAKTLIELQQRA